MKIIKIPFVKEGIDNEKGEREVANLVLSELGKIYPLMASLELEEIHVDNSDKKKAEELVYENSREELGKDRVIFVSRDDGVKDMLVNSFISAFDNCFFIYISPFFNTKLNIDSSNFILLGAKNLNNEQRENLNTRKIKYFEDIGDSEAVADFITEKARGKNVYVSIDLNVLDLAFAPGTDGQEPLGMTSRELFYLLRRIFHMPGIKAIDVSGASVEFDEKYNFRTIKLAAKVIQEFLDLNN